MPKNSAKGAISATQTQRDHHRNVAIYRATMKHSVITMPIPLLNPRAPALNATVVNESGNSRFRIKTNAKKMPTGTMTATAMSIVRVSAINANTNTIGIKSAR